MRARRRGLARSCAGSSRLEALDGLTVNVLHGDTRDRGRSAARCAGSSACSTIAGTTQPRAARAGRRSRSTWRRRESCSRRRSAPGCSARSYTSSVAAVGPAPPDSTADETNVWDAGRYAIPYVDSKHEAEVEALRLIARGLPLVIVNPAHVLGAGDPGRSSTTLVRRFLRRQIPAYVDGTLNIVGVDDVARGHLLADEHGVIGERYILGNRNFTARSPVRRPRATVGGRAAGVEAAAWRSRWRSRRAPSAAADRGCRRRSRSAPRRSNWAFSSARARRELHWKTSPHEDCLEETIAWYREREGSSLAPRRTPPAARDRGWSEAWRGVSSRAVATLYRCTTPTNWLCPCGRVARALDARGGRVRARSASRSADRGGPRSRR